MHSVNNAINFAVDYVALLNIRFPNKIDFQVDASVGQNNYDYIPVMSLQLLIENAVNPNRSLEKASCHFLMTAIRKTALYMLDS